MKSLFSARFILIKLDIGARASGSPEFSEGNAARFRLILNRN